MYSRRSRLKQGWLVGAPGQIAPTPVLNPSGSGLLSSRVQDLRVTGDAQVAGSNFFAGPMYTPIAANPQVELSYGQGAFTKIRDVSWGPYGQSAQFDSRGMGWPTKQLVIRGPSTNPGGSLWYMDNVPIPPQYQPWLDWEHATFTSYPDERHSVIYTADRIFDIYESDFTIGTPWGSWQGACLRKPGVSHGWWDNRIATYCGHAGCASDGIGMVRKDELVAAQALQAGGTRANLGHAMLFVLSNDITAGSQRQPALTGDGQAGTYNSSLNFQYGSLFQLNPTISDSTFLGWGFPTGDLPILHTMQDYGMYLIDCTGPGGHLNLTQSEIWNNSGHVTGIQSVAWGTSVSFHLASNLRLIGINSVPCTTTNGLIYDTPSVFGQPHT